MLLRNWKITNKPRGVLMIGSLAQHIQADWRPDQTRDWKEFNQQRIQKWAKVPKSMWIREGLNPRWDKQDLRDLPAGAISVLKTQMRILTPVFNQQHQTKNQRPQSPVLFSLFPSKEVVQLLLIQGQAPQRMRPAEKEATKIFLRLTLRLRFQRN